MIVFHYSYQYKNKCTSVKYTRRSFLAGETSHNYLHKTNHSSGIPANIPIPWAMTLMFLHDFT